MAGSWLLVVHVLVRVAMTTMEIQSVGGVVVLEKRVKLLPSKRKSNEQAKQNPASKHCVFPGG